MIDKINQLLKEVKDFTADSADEVEQLRIKILGKKGELNKILADFRNVPNEQKPQLGKLINDLKVLVQEKVNELKKDLQKSSDKQSDIDFSLPGYPQPVGTRHPISIVRNEIVEIFKYLGFTVAEGPEIEDDWHNFSALNFPPEHPARDMQDTFFVEENQNILLRTHTSNGQIRVMENQDPPLRIILPGRVFRNEAISARSHCIFHQIEGIYIDENVSFADLKQTLLYFAKEFFGSETKIRLRPSYFPFTEPSGEMDVTCSICKGKGCNVCKYTGWLEILGCGMIDPNVLESNKIDSEKYTGFAFGMGIERITMLKYGIKDIRLFFENDVRFLNQFKTIV
jgi:phenylalanyl-tRNA synthetase alpha chain